MEESGISRRGILAGGAAAGILGMVTNLGTGPASAAPLAVPAAIDPATVPHTYFAFDTGLWNGHLMTNCQVTMGEFVKDTANSPLFREGIFETPKLPWEPRYDNGYPNVFWDPEQKKYRCYYTLFIRDPASLNTPPKERAKTGYVIANRQTGLAYAESTDGVHWSKPHLGIVDFDGSTDNNPPHAEREGRHLPVHGLLRGRHPLHRAQAVAGQQPRSRRRLPQSGVQGLPHRPVHADHAPVGLERPGLGHLDEL